MSRTIKFRVWDSIENKYLYMEQQGFIITPHSNGAGVTIPYHKEDNENFDEDCFDWADADLLTGRYELEQDTGLKDRNGKEIYEGDIIKVVNVHDGDEECWEQPYGPAIPQEVKWNEELLRWSFGGCRRILCAPEDFEVIGNIHENPELLGGK